MATEKREFQSSNGELLAARFDRPDGKIRGYALFAHCFTCSKDIAAARRLAARLADNGIAVLRFDFTGLGHCLTLRGSGGRGLKSRAAAVLGHEAVGDWGRGWELFTQAAS